VAGQASGSLLHLRVQASTCLPHGLRALDEVECELAAAQLHSCHGQQAPGVEEVGFLLLTLFQCVTYPVVDPRRVGRLRRGALA
jgi:hypothetical protein